MIFNNIYLSGIVGGCIDKTQYLSQVLYFFRLTDITLSKLNVFHAISLVKNSRKVIFLQEGRGLRYE